MSNAHGVLIVEHKWEGPGYEPGPRFKTPEGVLLVITMVLSTCSVAFVNRRESPTSTTPLTPVQVIRSSKGEALNLTQIQNAGSNFFLLGEILRVSPGKTKLLREPELCLQLLNQLGTDALSSAADRSKAEPLLQLIALSQD